MGLSNTKANMRTATLIIVSLAIIYASASPIADSVVPEESLFALDDDLSEAQQKINQMTAEGASDKDCRKLVTETRKDIQINVDNCQKTIDAMPKGEHCVNLGQAAVKAATEAKSKADKHYKHTTTEVTKASSASVNFGSRTFSSLTEGKCDTFYSSTSYTTATASYEAAVTAKTKAKGAAEEASKSLTAVIATAAKEKHECECKTKADHKNAFATHSAADAANQKSWNFACKVECVLDGKTNCKCSAAPKCKAAKLTASVDAAQCAAKSSWIRIAQQNIQKSLFPPSAKTAFRNNQPNAFLDLAQNNKYLKNGKYKFKLTYGGNGFGRVTAGKPEYRTATWTQTSWPTDSKISGFTCLDAGCRRWHHPTGYDAKYWRHGKRTDKCTEFEGLARSSTGVSILDGNPSSGCWWNCVGCIAKHEGGIPAAMGQIADTMEMWVEA